jgi:hypothetical protein
VPRQIDRSARAIYKLPDVFSRRFMPPSRGSPAGLVLATAIGFRENLGLERCVFPLNRTSAWEAGRSYFRVHKRISWATMLLDNLFG